MRDEHKNQLAALRHEMVVCDAEASSLTASLDEEALSLRKQVSELLAERELVENKYQAEREEKEKQCAELTNQLSVLQQVSVKFSLS